MCPIGRAMASATSASSSMAARSAAPPQLDGSIAAMGDGVFVGDRIRRQFRRGRRRRSRRRGAARQSAGRRHRPMGQAARPWTSAPISRTRSASIRPACRQRRGRRDAEDSRAGQPFRRLRRLRRQERCARRDRHPRRAGRQVLAPAKGKRWRADESFVVGYDGHAYIKYLGASNAIAAEDGEAECRASFAYAPTDGKRAKIGPIPCQ